MADTKIEWATKVWNPVTGCTKVSQGCKHCYAERIFGRNLPEMKGQKFTEVRCHEDRLPAPLHWRKPQRIFVNSMSDLFHEDVPDAFIDMVLAVVAASPQHTFLVLTKRPQRMLDYFAKLVAGNPAEQLSTNENWKPEEGHSYSEEFECRVANSISGVLGAGLNVGWPMRNLWLGVSVEDQKAADDRIPPLLQTPAALRFLSVEPMLGPIDIRNYVKFARFEEAYRNLVQQCGGEDKLPSHLVWNGTKPPALDWVIVGGESGPGARPMHPDWARSLRDQCQAAGVPFFFKQHGEWCPQSHIDDCCPRDVKFMLSDGRFIEDQEAACPNESTPEFEAMLQVGKKLAGRLLDGREWNELPEVPNAH